MEKRDAYFISDAHIGIRLKGYEDREIALHDFLKSIAGSASHLFIVGDLFDFWIEYGTVIRADYFPTIHVLRSLADSGTEIHYLAGNHDFALGPFLPAQVRVRVHPGHLDIRLQEKSLHIFHGDGIVAADVGYRLLRRILRNPFNQRLYKLLHPDIGIRLGTSFSGMSRKYLGNFLTKMVMQEYRNAAVRYLRQDSDIVVFGHTHRPELVEFDRKFYCNTGEWIRKYTYARLRDGSITLWQHMPGGTDQELAPVKYGASSS